MSSINSKAPSASNSSDATKHSRRRDKPQLSCTLCRRRKLKCDRQQPCSTCTIRGLSLSCTYVAGNNAAGRVSKPQPQPQPQPQTQTQTQDQSSSTATVQARLNQLEALVASFVAKSQKAEGRVPAADADPPDLSDSFGRITLAETKASYVGSSHWTAVIDGIAELKGQISDDPSSSEEEYDDDEEYADQTDGPELLFGKHNYVTKEEILAAVPPKATTDQLLGVWFRGMDMASAFLHGPTFLDQYEQFWKDPSNTPIMWIGFLFCLLCQAIQFFDNSKDINGELPPSSRRSVRQYKRNIAQCLILGKYTKAPPYTVEVFLLYFHIEQLYNDDANFGNWILLGMLVRLAMRMGYHRDPSHFPNISPFQGEMRRRIWGIIVQHDIVCSNLIGLPRMTQASQYDTGEPRNLLDEDFGPQSGELPPGRPDTFHTPILYSREKNRVLGVVAKVRDLVSAARQYTYDDVMDLDAEVKAVKKAIPPSLQMKPLTILTNTDIWMRQMHLSLLLAEAQCVLHRRYLLLGKRDTRYRYSTTTCVEAALQVLHYQDIFYREKQHGGRLYEHRWKYNSLVKHDFLLATTLLCVDLNEDISIHEGVKTGPADPPPGLLREKEKVVKALERSYEIWMQSCSTSKEARKAATTLELVLGKAHQADPSRGSDSGFSVSSISLTAQEASHNLSGTTLTLSGTTPAVHTGSEDHLDMNIDQWTQPPWSFNHTTYKNDMAVDEAEQFLPTDYLGFPGF